MIGIFQMSTKMRALNGFTLNFDDILNVSEWQKRFAPFIQSRFPEISV